MKAILKISLAIAAVAAFSSSAFAICDPLHAGTFIQGSISGRCPGAPTTPNGYCLIVGGTGATSGQSASFWTFGFGNPAVGSGSDNGSFASSGWMRDFGGYTYITGSWLQDPGIDGCYNGLIAPGKTNTIMAFLVSDNTGAFAVMSSTLGNPNALSSDFDIDLEGGSAAAASSVTLRPIPRPSIKASTRVAPNVNITVAGITLAQVQNAAYGDGGATAGDLIKGYKVYRQVVNRGAGAPSAHQIASGWVEATGAGTVFPLGTDASFTVTCSGTTAQDTYLGVSMVADGNFETSVVGTVSSAVQCGPTLANPNFKVIDKHLGPNKNLNPNS